jgi:hypothetical protein
LEELVEGGDAAGATVAFLELIGTPPTAITEMKAGPRWAHMQSFAPTLVSSCGVTPDGVVAVGLRLPTPQCAPNFAFLMTAEGRGILIPTGAA